MPQNDNAFKVMIQQSPEQFLARVLPGAELIEVLDIELPRESLYVDALLRVGAMPFSPISRRMPC